MSDTGETYIQFPLCALAFGDTDHTRLEHILCYGYVEAGQTLYAKFHGDDRKRIAAEFRGAPGTPDDYSINTSGHAAAMLGAQKIGIKPGSLRACLSQWKTLSEFTFQHAAKYGRDPEVRLAKGLVFEARDHTGIAYRELAILAAVYSLIGAKNYPVRITRQAIQCRMLGYKSPAIMQSELANRTDAAKPLTLRQINYTLDALHERQFFARARANERQTFYSHRMEQDALEKRLVEGKSYSQDFHQRRLQRNAELMARVKERKSAIKVNSPIKVDNERAKPENSTNNVHSASATVSAGVSTERPLECPP